MQPDLTTPSLPDEPSRQVRRRRANPRRGTIALALILICVGAWFLAIEFSPALKDFAYGRNNWPLPIIGIGILLAVVGIFTWSPDLLVPACVVVGIGGLLYWQNTTGNWESWSYVWTLIPGFAGVGTLLSGLMSWKRNDISSGIWQTIISLVLFAIFGTTLGDLGDLGGVVKYWPALVIVLGLWVLVDGIFRKR